MKAKIERSIKESIKAKEAVLATQVPNIEKAARAIIDSLSNGGKVLIFGNGGSAADSQHMAAELVGRFKKERRAAAAIALNCNSSTVTAIANDYGYEKVFSRQVEALARRGDVAIGISTSGGSKNVIEALERAKAVGAVTVGIVGSGGRMVQCCDISIAVAASDTPRIQESHIAIIHVICEMVEDAIAGEK